MPSRMIQPTQHDERGMGSGSTHSRMAACWSRRCWLPWACEPANGVCTVPCCEIDAGCCSLSLTRAYTKYSGAEVPDGSHRPKISCDVTVSRGLGPSSSSRLCRGWSCAPPRCFTAVTVVKYINDDNQSEMAGSFATPQDALVNRAVIHAGRYTHVKIDNKKRRRKRKKTRRCLQQTTVFGVYRHRDYQD